MTMLSVMEATGKTRRCQRTQRNVAAEAEGHDGASDQVRAAVGGREVQNVVADGGVPGDGLPEVLSHAAVHAHAGGRSGALGREAGHGDLARPTSGRPGPHHDVISAASAGLNLSVLYQRSVKLSMERLSDIEYVAETSDHHTFGERCQCSGGPVQDRGLDDQRLDGDQPHRRRLTAAWTTCPRRCSRRCNARVSARPGCGWCWRCRCPCWR